MMDTVQPSSTASQATTAVAAAAAAAAAAARVNNLHRVPESSPYKQAPPPTPAAPPPAAGQVAAPGSSQGTVTTPSSAPTSVSVAAGGSRGPMSPSGGSTYGSQVAVSASPSVNAPGSMRYHMQSSPYRTPQQPVGNASYYRPADRGPSQPDGPSALPAAPPPVRRISLLGQNNEYMRFDSRYAPGQIQIVELDMPLTLSGNQPPQQSLPHPPTQPASTNSTPQPFKKIRLGDSTTIAAVHQQPLPSLSHPSQPPLPPGVIKQELHQPLSVDIRESSSGGQPGYHPEVEAISPTLPDNSAGGPGNDDASWYRRTKDDLLKQIGKVDREIAKVESQISKLKRKQHELEGGAASAANDAAAAAATSDLPGPRHQSLAQTIYAENRRKAQEAHALLVRFGPKIDLPLYNQPSDTNLYHENRLKHANFRSKLLLAFKRRTTERDNRDRFLTATYARLSQEWSRKVERWESSIKRKGREQRNRELFEKVFPELRKQREDRERFNRVGNRVKSEAEFEEIVDGLQEQELEDKKMRSYAVIPPILLDERQRRLTYRNNNGLIEDFAAEYKERTLFNVWTDHEAEVFKEKYLQHPKNFGVIKTYVDRKSVSDCVQRYYLSKKTENYKQLLRKSRHRTRARNNPNNKANIESVLSGPTGVTTRLQREQQAKQSSASGNSTNNATSSNTNNDPSMNASFTPPPSSGQNNAVPLLNTSSTMGLAASPRPDELNTNNTSNTSGINTTIKEELSEDGKNGSGTTSSSTSTRKRDRRKEVASSVEKKSSRNSNPDKSSTASNSNNRSRTQIEGESTDEETAPEVTNLNDSPPGSDPLQPVCVVCHMVLHQPLLHSRPLSPFQANHHNLDFDSITKEYSNEPHGPRICNTCRCGRLRWKYTECPFGTCPNPKGRVKRLRPLPNRWHQVSQSVRDQLSQEYRIPSHAAKCCSSCFARLARRVAAPNSNNNTNSTSSSSTNTTSTSSSTTTPNITSTTQTTTTTTTSTSSTTGLNDDAEVSSEGTATAPSSPGATTASANTTPSGGGQPRWTEEEMEALKRGLNKHGTDWPRVASIVGSKTHQQCKNCYFNYRRRLGLDRYVRRHHNKSQVESSIDETLPTSDPPPSTTSSTPTTTTSSTIASSNTSTTISSSSSSSSTTTTTTTTTTANTPTISTSSPKPKPALTDEEESGSSTSTGDEMIMSDTDSAHSGTPLTAGHSNIILNEKQDDADVDVGQSTKTHSQGNNSSSSLQANKEDYDSSATETADEGQGGAEVTEIAQQPPSTPTYPLHHSMSGVSQLENGPSPSLSGSSRPQTMKELMQGVIERTLMKTHSAAAPNPAQANPPTISSILKCDQQLQSDYRSGLATLSVVTGPPPPQSMTQTPRETTSSSATITPIQSPRTHAELPGEGLGVVQVQQALRENECMTLDLSLKKPRTSESAFGLVKIPPTVNYYPSPNQSHLVLARPPTDPHRMTKGIPAQLTTKPGPPPPLQLSSGKAPSSGKSTGGGSITHGTSAMGHRGYASLSRPLSPPSQQPPKESSAPGSITQGTPLHHGEKRPSQHVYIDYYKRHHGASPSPGPPSVPPSSAGVPVSGYGPGGQQNPGPPPPPPPLPRASYAIEQQMTSRQIIMSDYFTSQQMLGGGARYPPNSGGPPGAGCPPGGAHQAPAATRTPSPATAPQRQGTVIQRHTPLAKVQGQSSLYPAGHEALSSLVDVAVQQPSLPVPAQQKDSNSGPGSGQPAEGLGKSMADHQPRVVLLDPQSLHDSRSGYLNPRDAAAFVQAQERERYAHEARYHHQMVAAAAADHPRYRDSRDDPGNMHHHSVASRYRTDREMQYAHHHHAAAAAAAAAAQHHHHGAAHHHHHSRAPQSQQNQQPQSSGSAQQIVSVSSAQQQQSQNQPPPPSASGPRHPYIANHYSQMLHPSYRHHAILAETSRSQGNEPQSSSTNSSAGRPGSNESSTLTAASLIDAIITHQINQSSSADAAAAAATAAVSSGAVTGSGGGSVGGGNASNANTIPPPGTRPVDRLFQSFHPPVSSSSVVDVRSSGESANGGLSSHPDGAKGGNSSVPSRTPYGSDSAESATFQTWKLRKALEREQEKQMHQQREAAVAAATAAAGSSEERQIIRIAQSSGGATLKPPSSGSGTSASGTSATGVSNYAPLSPGEMWSTPQRFYDREKNSSANSAPPSCVSTSTSGTTTSTSSAPPTSSSHNTGSTASTSSSAPSTTTTTTTSSGNSSSSLISPLDYVKNRIVEVMRTSEDDKRPESNSSTPLTSSSGATNAEEINKQERDAGSHNRANSPVDLIIAEEAPPMSSSTSSLAAPTFTYSYSGLNVHPSSPKSHNPRQSPKLPEGQQGDGVGEYRQAPATTSTGSTSTNTILTRKQRQPHL